MSLGRQKEERLAAYRALFQLQLEPKELEEIRLAVNGWFGLGNGRFKSEIAAMLGRRVEPGMSDRPRKNNGRSKKSQAVL